MADERDIDLVLVTGAGASCAFGVNGTSLPLMATWSDHLVRKLREAPMGYLAATGLADGMQAEQFERRLGDFLRSVDAFKSIDPLLGPITAIDSNLRPQANDADWRHWHEALSFQLDQIVAVIHKSLYEMFGAPKFDPGLVQQAYGSLLTTLGIGVGSRWVYATTNYDTIGEAAIAALDGLPDVGEVQMPPGHSERPIRVDGLLGGMPRYVPVLHLHGRVEWFRRPGMGLRSTPVERYDPQFGTPVVMLPDLEKSYEGDPTIASLWREFVAALSRAKRVLVLGHSLHDAALLKALRENIELSRVAVTYLPQSPDEHPLRERIAKELPVALALPFRFEANIEFTSQPLTQWLASTAQP